MESRQQKAKAGAKDQFQLSRPDVSALVKGRGPDNQILGMF